MGLWTAGTIERRADSRRIGRGLRLALLTCFALLALPAAAQAANVTLSNGTLTYNAGAGETNTAVIVKQQTTAVATIYFVGDQNPDVNVTATPTGAGLDLPTWLRRLHQEYHQLRSSQGQVNDLVHRRFQAPIAVLSHQQVKDELARWEEPIE